MKCSHLIAVLLACSGAAVTSLPVAAEPLVNKLPHHPIDGAQDSIARFSFDVPPEARRVEFTLSQGYGDANLYASFGREPTLSAYDYASTNPGNLESIIISAPAAGTYELAVHAFDSIEGVAIEASVILNSDTTLTKGVPFDGLSAVNGELSHFTFEVPEHAHNVRVSTFSGVGNADLYVSYNRQATPADADYASTNSGTDEAIAIDGATAAGTYYATIAAADHYQDVSLSATYTIKAPVVVADLDDDPNAIWQRAPGFYKEGEYWFAIIHTRPSITRVSIYGDFTEGESGALPLAKSSDGKFWWLKVESDAFSRAPLKGDRYKFLLEEQDGFSFSVQDPAARWVESSALEAYSRVTVSEAFTWSDSGWSRPSWDYYSIYQLHPLRFTDRNAYLNPLQQVTEELDNDGSNDYINKLGVTAIALLPVNEFAGNIGWGYNPSFFYAVEESYGGPEALKALVDEAHAQGIAVILDVVFNHAGTTDNILWQIAQNSINDGTYFDGDTAWGAMLNFDNDVARHFIVQNMVYLAKEFHIDAFRFDATRLIHTAGDPSIRIAGSGGGWDFLREIRTQVKAIDPNIILIAEELPNNWHITQEDIGSSWADDYHAPFDSQWADPFHDHFKDVLTGGHLDNLYSVFTYFGDSWHDPLIYTESHDEVGNVDGRIARNAREGKGWEMNQIALAGTTLARGIPMIFMGQESGEWEQFGQDGLQWWDHRLPLDTYENDTVQSKVLNWSQRIQAIRRGDIRRFADSDINLVHVHDANGVAAFTRDNGKYLVILNFKGGSWQEYDIGVRGTYQELANTSWPAFNVGGVTERTRGGNSANYIESVPVPAYGAVVLVRWD